MKPVRRTDSSSQSCSCTSCLYKSESEQPSIRKYILHGSRIDRLYYGKYIPLRERKLLNRLVRTRAVYDDLRARLISDSTLSLDKTPDLRPRKHHHAINTLDSTEKRGAILEIVDYIDKGGLPDQKKLSECCSCCSCSSKMKISGSYTKQHKHIRSYVRAHEGEYGENVQATIRERYNKSGVRFKAKHIRSDPCTCTLKFSGLIKKGSKALIKKIHSVPLEQLSTTEVKHIVKDSKLQSFGRKSYQQYKNMQEKLEKELKKLNESKENVKKNLRLHTKKSFQRIKQAKHKLKTDIESGIRKSAHAVKSLHQTGTFESLEYPEDETKFRIKKDSIVKFRDYLKRKEMMKDWECDLECIPDSCVPEQCFKIIKLRRSHKRRQQRSRKNIPDYKMLNRDIKVDRIPVNRSSTSVQAGKFAMTTSTNMKKQKPLLRTKNENRVKGQHMILETKEVYKPGLKQGIEFRKILQQKKIGKSIGTSAPSSVTIRKETALGNVKETRYIRRKRGASKEREHVKTDKSNTSNRQVEGIGSSFSFDLEFSKRRSVSKTSNKSNQPSYIEHVPKGKRKRVQRHHKVSQVVLRPSLEAPEQVLIESKVKPKKQETKMMQTRSLLKNFSAVKTNTDNEAKSVLSLTKKTDDNNMSKAMKNKELLLQRSNDELMLNVKPSYPKQAVRIRSTFSFNVEFYKTGNQDEVKTPSFNGEVKLIPIDENLRNVKKKKTKKSHSKSSSVLGKVMRVKHPSVKRPSVKSKYIQAKTTLTKCLCWSNIHKLGKTRKKIETSTIGTMASLTTDTKVFLPSTVDKNIDTMKTKVFELPRNYKALPYECEPGFCIPGKCDPLVCHKFLEMRNSKLKTQKSKGSYTSSRKTKSTSSVALKSVAPRRAKEVQSAVTAMKIHKITAPRKYKENIKLGRNESNLDEPGRQAVRIGSNFSFNIEFYKDKLAPVHVSNSRISSTTKEVINKPRNFKKNQYQQPNKYFKPMHTQITELDNKLLSLKRCFCTLKLFKNKNSSLNRQTKAKKLTADTQTIGIAYPIVETMTKSTKTNWKWDHELLPFECEPYFCVPGECDPNLCLEKIKRTMLHTKDYGMFTGRPKMTSKLSFTEDPYKKSAAILAHPKLYPKGTNVNENYMKYPRRKRDPNKFARTNGSGPNLGSTNSRQAVRIVSSFNFSIQFSKQLPQAVTFTKQPIRKQTVKVKDKNIKVTRVLVDDANIQSEEAKKVHKALLMRPMLKRCFCTLNLQKKTKQPIHKGQWLSENKYFTPNIYTVSTAMTNKTELISKQNIEESAISKAVRQKKRIISISTSSFLFKNYVNSFEKYGTLQLGHALNIPVRLKQPLKVNSNISMEIKFIRKYCLPKTNNIKCPLKSFSYACMDGKIRQRVNVLNPSLTQISRPNSGRLTHIDQYLERCYCVMNVHVLRANDNRVKGMNHHLKPYECKPGICIPDECNPYECQKLIMKRLMKNVHKESSTETTNKSVSSYATYSESGSKSTQYKTDVQNRGQELKAKKYKPNKPVREINQKRVVRIGSTFSFDIEFSKRNLSKKKSNQYVPSPYHKGPIKRKRTKVMSERSQGTVNLGKDRQLQSTVKLTHKSSSYAPMMKRCFCTLKLQKRGRMNKEYEKLHDLPIKEPSTTMSRSVKVGTINAKYQDTPRLDMRYLKSYECEPGICTPGECNPYKCLELRKKRKNFGMNATGFGAKSISSMTREGNHFRKRHKTRAVGVKLKKVNNKTMKRNEALKRIVDPPISTPSSRQAVRIGSNFSFNIEFFKDTSRVSEINKTFKRFKKTKRSDGSIRQKKHREDLKDSFSQSFVSVNHSDTQVVRPTIEKPTMTTSFLRRCFCTAKLHGIKFLGQQNTQFKHLPHLRNKGTNDVLGRVRKNVYPEVPTLNKSTITEHRQRLYALPLEPYECEPGICNPGQCNPYLCDKIIQQRLFKQHSRASGTEPVNMLSVSSTSAYRKRPRHEGTQSRNIKRLTHKKYLKEIPTDKTSSNSKDKHIVRIGSNFSFNVEFYKDNVGNIKETSKGITEKVRDIKDDTIRNIQYKVKHRKQAGTKSIPLVRNNHAQVKHKKVKTFGVSPIKRCFCTLKLLNKRINKEKMASQEDSKTIITNKTVGTQLRNRLVHEVPHVTALAPYECEPFTCVPGECDPVECLERIRRRKKQTKEFGTITKYPERKSIGSISTRIRKDENLQVGFTRARPNKAIQKTSYVEKHKVFDTADHARQAVRIRSDFSFNIEFFKDSGSGTPKQDTNMFFDQFDVGKSSKKYHKKPQQSPVERVAYSQVPNIKGRSSGTDMSDIKRCFCTLQLKNNDHRKFDNPPIKTHFRKPKSKHSSVGKFLKSCMCALKLNKAGKLFNQSPPTTLNYEVKGTSTYNSNVKQNKIKPVKILAPYECEPYTCVPGECDPYECWDRMKKTRVRNFGTYYKRHLKDTATDSIKSPVTVCTEVQCAYKTRVRSQKTSFPERRQHGRETTHFSSDPFHNRNKQAVRIGSNFSFNIEFFKERAYAEGKEYKKIKPEKKTNIGRTPRKLQTKFKGSDAVRTNLRNQGSQSPYVKRQFVHSVSNTAPKRCFCTLNLLKQQNNFKPNLEYLQPSKITEDKMTATKNKYMIQNELYPYECPPYICIPDECDPYDCLDKMNRRGIIFKSQSVGTRAENTSLASVGSRTLKIRAHKTQAKPVKKRKYTYALHSEPRSLPTSQYKNRHNKRAVRIGSNFNFNIEFLKQKSQPAVIRKQKIVRARYKEEDSKSYLNKTVPAKKETLRHHYSQLDGTKKKDQASHAGNTLKRCFCTLQLQNAMPHRVPRQNMFHPGINIKYPQVITVGRVAIEPFPKNLMKSQRLRNVNKVRRSTSTNSRLLTDYRNVSTKTDKKYLRNKDVIFPPCNPSTCPDYTKRKFLRKETKNDMDTILPYSPSKFHRKESKTIILDKDKFEKIRDRDDKPHDISMFDKGKRLTAKKSKKSIPTKNHKGGVSNSFLCRYAKKFFKPAETSPKISGKQRGINNEHPYNVKFTIVPKKSKGINLNKQIVDENRSILDSKYIDKPKKKIITLQRGDSRNNIVKSQSTDNEYFKYEWKNKIGKDRQSKSEERKKPSSMHQKTRVTFADNIKNSDVDIPKEKYNKLLPHKPNTRALCYSCSENNCPLQTHTRKSGQDKRGIFGLFANCLIKKFNTPVVYSESADDCQYCECCKRKIDVDEISKGAGDRRSIVSSKYKSDITICPCSKDYVHSNENRTLLGKKSNADDTLGQKFSRKKKKCCSKPLLEMPVDSVNYAIVNKNQLRHINQLKSHNGKEDTQSRKVKKSHGDSCICCKCIKKRQVPGATISVPAKDTADVVGPAGKLFPSKKIIIDKPKKPIVYPCVCGSKKCAKEAKKQAKKPQVILRVQRGKRCVCGSPVCRKERHKMKETEELICKCQETIEKRIIRKKKRKELERRLKIDQEKDEIRRHKRIKRNKELERRVKKYKHASDILLAADSVIDVAKLGVTTLKGALRTAAKTVYDPEVAFESMRCKKNDPESVLKQLERKYMESDAASTARRLKMRCLFMKRVQDVKQKLEDNPITHFLMHVADKNAKTRKFKRKPVRRRREPLDFNCSLYMASLRKRPYLSIYYKWPWFYPHFITMINIWKQFTDIALFLLAAVVWSPCILCMEGCRAMMCCFFCTG